ncbi:MAG: hypothetical protein ACI8X5_001534 [Planctomycetota bacterium]|jgi:uncharacterized protein YkwD
MTQFSLSHTAVDRLARCLLVACATCSSGVAGELSSKNSREAIAQAEDPEGAELERLELALVKASVSKRDEAWEALSGHEGAGVGAALRKGLEVRWDEAASSLASSKSLKSLERVAQDREILDLQRAQALQLIFDKVRYFYPYRPPECPPERARLYQAVQREVDELVSELRDEWETPRKAKIAKGFHADVAELSWCRERAVEIKASLVLPELLSRWVFLVPASAKSINTQQFALTREEERRFVRDALVREHNRGLWGEKKRADEDQQADKEERRQVEITNDYRVMFGRRALAWNPDLQASAAGHSDYMARTGDFGHYEKDDPERESPFDRMALSGYNYGVSENCHYGGGTAQGAHDGWIRSSGHHRNLLIKTHTEMASGANGSYWTQNFGTGSEFRSDIKSWQD